MSEEHPPEPAVPHEQRQRQWPRRFNAVLVAVGLVIVSIGAGALLGAVPALVLRATDAGLAVTVAASLVVSELVYAAVASAYLAWRSLRVRLRSPSLLNLVWVVLGVIVLYVLQMVATVLMRVFEIGDTGSALTQIGKMNPAFLIFVAVASIVLVGPAEELLFRGVIQRRLRDSFGPAAAVGISSILFAGAHVFGYSGAVAGIAIAIMVTFVISVVLGYTYERTGNLVVNALLHGFYNAVTLVVAYFALTVSS